MGKIYGSLDNRLEENRIYTKDKLIHEGDDITMYYWSDRTCYYVTKVIDQKHIFIHEYSICADHSKAGGQGHQNWMYFKTEKEMRDYLSEFFPEDKDKPVFENQDTEIVFRYGKWKSVLRYTKEQVENNPDMWRCRPRTEKEKKLYDEGKEVVQYFDLGGKISFGVRSYYYDWEF